MHNRLLFHESQERETLSNKSRLSLNDQEGIRINTFLTCFVFVTSHSISYLIIKLQTIDLLPGMFCALSFRTSAFDSFDSLNIHKFSLIRSFLKVALSGLDVETHCCVLCLLAMPSDFIFHRVERS